jgi:hypothetical protein
MSDLRPKERKKWLPKRHEQDVSPLSLASDDAERRPLRSFGLHNFPYPRVLEWDAKREE